jgi:hypothetical protein
MRYAIPLCMLLASAGQAQTPPGAETAAKTREAHAAAAASLATLKELVTPENAAGMGFRSPEEAGEATLAQPIPVFMVQLDELRAYSSERDPSSLLHRLDKAVVPAVVGGSVRSSIVVEKVGERWTATSFGAPKLARLLSDARDASARTGGIPADACFAVHVAALNSYYIGYRSGPSLMLTAVLDEPALDLRAGQSARANEAFAKLAAVARDYNGLPL